ISLLEMSRIYKIKPTKQLFYIRIPLIIPSLLTSLVNSLGLAWKSGVAAEVICLPSVSLGTILWSAKGNVDFEQVYAVTLTVVVLSIVIEILLKFFVKKLLKGRT
ncbi:MAG: ABC transporter permease subunit, partial [Clostridia bacterium]|nr:ABC transporter permease subunit [Clostridia bacterium]